MIQRVELPQGAVILMETVAYSASVSVGFFFLHGSGNEVPTQQGFSHLWEHMVFKGTQTRTSYQIASEIDRVGGDLNAYTDKEETALLATIPPFFTKKALEILIDMSFFSTFPPAELEREIDVIKNEILSIEDDPEECSFEYFLRLLWGDHPLAQPTAGTNRSIGDVTSEQLHSFARDFFGTDRMVIVLAGHFDPQEVTSFLTDHLPERKTKTSATLNLPFQTPFRIQVRNRFQMSQVLLASVIPSPENIRTSLILQLFSNAFGENMSSRLFQNIREKKGLSYSVFSFSTEISGITGLHISAGTVPKNAAKLLEALELEWETVKKQGLSAVEWADAKSYWEGSSMIALEKNENRVGRLFHLYHRFGITDEFAVNLEMMKSLTLQEATEFLSRTIFSQDPSVLVFGGGSRIAGLKSNEKKLR